MPSEKIRYEGVTVTEKYLTVTFTLGDQRARRVHDVKVPVEHLVTACVAEVINKSVARSLKAYWEEGEVPLFIP